MSCLCRRRAAVLCLLGISIAPTVGCGKNPYQTARVTGTVFCGERPAEGGTVVLRPIEAPDITGRPKNRPGQSATGIVEADGTFSLMMQPLGSDRGGPGALIGPHEVIFRMPLTESRQVIRTAKRASRDEVDKDLETDDEAVYDELHCGRAIWPDTVDVAAGSNVLKFVLLPKSFDPKPVEKRRGNGFVEDHIKIDPTKVDPALLKYVEDGR